MGQWLLNIDFIYQSPVFKMLRCGSLSQIFCNHVSEIDLAHEWGSHLVNRVLRERALLCQESHTEMFAELETN